jgi:uncharacterized protein YoxC/ribosomal protein S16
MSDLKNHIQNNAAEVIEKFGGIRPMANKMGVAATTIQGWKKRGSIPENRIEDIIKAARDNDISLTDTEDQSTDQVSSQEQQESPEVFEQSGPEKEEAASPTKGSSFAEQMESTTEASSETTKESDEKTQSGSGQTTVQEPPASAREKVKASVSDPSVPEARRPVQFGTWLAVAAIVIVFVSMIAVMLPVRQNVEQNQQRLSEIERNLKGLKKEQESFLGSMSDYLPEDMQSRMTEFQKRTGELSEQVGQLANQTKDIAKVVVGGDSAQWKERITQIEAQLSQLVSSAEIQRILNRFQELKQSAGGDEQLDQATTQLRNIMESLGGRVDLLDEALVVARENSTTLGETFENIPNEDLKAAAYLLVLNQFRSSLNRQNKPFEEDLELLQDMVGKDNPELQESLKRLAPHAESGVLSAEGLSRELRGLAGDVAVSSLKGEDVTIAEQAQTRLSKVLQIKKDGQPMVGSETQKKVEMAQAELQQGDLRQAKSILQQIQGPAANTLKPFMSKLEGSIAARDVEQAVTSILRDGLGVGPRPFSVENPNPSALQQLQGDTVVKDKESGFIMMDQ